MALGHDYTVAFFPTGSVGVDPHYSPVKTGHEVAYGHASADMADAYGLELLHAANADVDRKSSQLISFLF